MMGALRVMMSDHDSGWDDARDHGGFPFMDDGSLMAGLESLALDMP